MSSAACGVLGIDGMERPMRFIDEHGALIDPRVEGALLQMRGRLRRHFPACRDDLTAAEVFEEAARRLARRERRFGRIENLHAYAWVTLRSVITSRLRGGAARLEERTIRARNPDALLASRLATRHTAREVEHRVLLGQLLSSLTGDEQRVCAMKAEGFSAGEIGRALGRSPASIDTLYSRAKARARRLGSRNNVARPSRNLRTIDG